MLLEELKKKVNYPYLFEKQFSETDSPARYFRKSLSIFDFSGYEMDTFGNVWTAGMVDGEYRLILPKQINFKLIRLKNDKTHKFADKSIYKMYQVLFKPNELLDLKIEQYSLKDEGFPNHVITKDNFFYKNGIRVATAIKKGFSIPKVNLRFEDRERTISVDYLYNKYFNSPLVLNNSKDIKTLDFIGYPNHFITKDKQVWNNINKKWIALVKGTTTSVTLFQNCKGKKFGLDRLYRKVFENFIEDYPVEDICLLVDIPKKYDKKSLYYKERIIKREYHLYVGYAVVKDVGIWSYKDNKFLKLGYVNGYSKHSFLKTDGSHTNRPTHVIMMDAFSYENPGDKLIIHHKDRDKKNFRLENLIRCTYLEHVLIHSTDYFWKENADNHRKLTDLDILNIRKENSKRRLSQEKIAHQYKVSQSTVSRICK